MTRTKIVNYEATIASIVDAEGPIFENQPNYVKTLLLRHAALALNEIEPLTVENLTMSHELGEWARQLDNATLASQGPCECGRPDGTCVCDQNAAEEYLATGDSRRLIGLGWDELILNELLNGDTRPAELQTGETRNFHQKSITPVVQRFQGL